MVAAHDVLNGLAAQLAEMAASMRDLAERGPRAGGETSPANGTALDVLAEGLLRQRHARARFLPPSLFHEPAWEILLSLYVAQRRGRTLNVKHLVEEVDAPVTTSQRWIDTLAHMKLVQRLADVNDRRRIELSLSENAMDAMERYLTWLASQQSSEQASNPGASELPSQVKRVHQN
jgi:DNA-binding MarR family transcriptional regulator